MNKENAIAFIVVAALAFWVGGNHRENNIAGRLLACDMNNIEPTKCVKMLWPNLAKENTPNGQ